MHLAVRSTPLDLGDIQAAVADDAAGAVVLFTGVVRNHSPGHEGVTHLEYEAFLERVEDTLREIGRETEERWDVLRIAIEHRVGRCEVGDPTVAVAVSASHRGEAFEAARYCIDQLKGRAPIWKKEFWPDGEEWSPGS